MIEQYKPKPNVQGAITNVLLIAAIILLLTILGIVSDTRDKARKISGDMIDLVSGSFTGTIGQPVGQDARYEK